MVCSAQFSGQSDGNRNISGSSCSAGSSLSSRATSNAYSSERDFENGYLDGINAPLDDSQYNSLSSLSELKVQALYGEIHFIEELGNKFAERDIKKQNKRYERSIH